MNTIGRKCRDVQTLGVSTEDRPLPNALGDHLKEALAPLGLVTVRRMFGGAGLFFDGLMFALISDDVLYLKADAATQAAFKAEGLGPFTYAKLGGTATLTSYWQAPDRLLDDHEDLQAWARTAIAVARRGAAAKTAKAGR
ncbi:MAG: TfoX/Sxy family protein [Hyphomicrobiaceae bacterium]